MSPLRNQNEQLALPELRLPRGPDSYKNEGNE